MYVSADYDNIESAWTPELWRANLDLWGLHPDTLNLMRRLKRAWDRTCVFDSEMFRPITDTFGGVKDYPCG